MFNLFAPKDKYTRNGIQSPKQKKKVLSPSRQLYKVTFSPRLYLNEADARKAVARERQQIREKKQHYRLEEDQRLYLSHWTVGELSHYPKKYRDLCHDGSCYEPSAYDHRF